MQFFWKTTQRTFDVYKTTHIDVWGELLFNKTKSYKTVCKIFNSFEFNKTNKYFSSIFNDKKYVSGHVVTKHVKLLLRRLVLFRNYLFFKKFNKRIFNQYKRHFLYSRELIIKPIKSKKLKWWKANPIRKHLFIFTKSRPFFLMLKRSTKLFRIKSEYIFLILKYIVPYIHKTKLPRSSLKIISSVFTFRSIVPQRFNILKRINSFVQRNRFRKYNSKPISYFSFDKEEPISSVRLLRFPRGKVKSFQKYNSFISAFTHYYSGTMLESRFFNNFFTLFLNKELTITTVLQRTNWFYSYYFIKTLIKQGGIIVNGSIIFDGFYNMEPGDHLIVNERYKPLVFNYTHVLLRLRFRVNKSILRRYSPTIRISGWFWKKKNYIKRFFKRNFFINYPLYMELNNKLLSLIILRRPKKSDITLPFWFIL